MSVTSAEFHLYSKVTHCSLDEIAGFFKIFSEYSVMARAGETSETRKLVVRPGARDWSAGEHKLTVEVIGIHEKAEKAYQVRMDYFKLEPVK